MRLHSGLVDYTRSSWLNNSVCGDAHRSSERRYSLRTCRNNNNNNNKEPFTCRIRARFFLLEKIISSRRRVRITQFLHRKEFSSVLKQWPTQDGVEYGGPPPPLLGHLPAIRAKAHILICVKFEGKLSAHVGIYLLRPLLWGGKAPPSPIMRGSRCGVLGLQVP